MSALGLLYPCTDCVPCSQLLFVALRQQARRSTAMPGRILQVDKLCETKGLDEIDREKAKRHARDQVGPYNLDLKLCTC